LPFNLDIESLLEYIDKINSPTIKELKKTKDLTEFNKNYGDVSFLLVDENELNNFEINENHKILKEIILNCYNKFAENYKPLFYFAYMSHRKYPNFYNINLPAIISLGLNEEFNIHLSLSEFENKYNKDIICSKINRFIETNKFPVLKRLDESYHNKISKEKKIMIIAAIDRKDKRHISFLNNIFHYIALDNREDFIFTYIDFDDDKYFFNFFNVKFDKEKNKNINNNFDFPMLFAYNFDINKYYVDYNSLTEENNFLVKNDKMQIQKILDDIIDNKIKWTSGYYLQDLLNNFIGNNLSNEFLIMVYSGILFSICLMIITIFYFICGIIYNEKKRDCNYNNTNDKKIKRKINLPKKFEENTYNENYDNKDKISNDNNNNNNRNKFE
jgi:hypothetical protein